jgi:hypothetical protein
VGFNNKKQGSSLIDRLAFANTDSLFYVFGFTTGFAITAVRVSPELLNEGV